MQLCQDAGQVDVQLAIRRHFIVPFSIFIRLLIQLVVHACALCAHFLLAALQPPHLSIRARGLLSNLLSTLLCMQADNCHVSVPGGSSNALRAAASLLMTAGACGMTKHMRILQKDESPQSDDPSDAASHAPQCDDLCWLQARLCTA